MTKRKFPSKHNIFRFSKPIILLSLGVAGIITGIQLENIFKSENEEAKHAKTIPSTLIGNSNPTNFELELGQDNTSPTIQGKKFIKKNDGMERTSQKQKTSQT